MVTQHGHVLVVGSGVIGATSAFRLARAGWRVTVFDPSPGRGATWAAAGMIAPGAEIIPGERDNFHRQRVAVGAWEELSEQLRLVSGERIALHRSGTLFVGLDGSDRLLLEQFRMVAVDFGVVARPVTRESTPDLFDGVSARVREGLFLSGDAWVDPDQVMSMLGRANDVLGVKHVSSEVLRVSREDNGVCVETDSENYRGDLGLLTTGASSLPLGARGEASHVVRPVRGMTLRVNGVDRSAQPTLRAFVHGRSFYMVSRPGGYCVLGASSDERRDANIDVGELSRLLRDALEIVPDLDSGGFIEVRQGLRPVTRVQDPFLEVLDTRWAWLSGHYRHGVTLAPLASLEALEFVEQFT